MFRAEEMATLAGGIRLEGDGTGRKVVNGSELELRDATLIDINSPDRDGWKERVPGTIAPGASVEIGAEGRGEFPEKVEAEPGPAVNVVLAALRTTWENRDENFGEIRLVAWVASLMPGQEIEPAPDRRRGYTAVLVHIRSGPPPSPDGQHYNILALGPEKPLPIPPQNNSMMRGRGRSVRRVTPVPQPPPADAPPQP